MSNFENVKKFMKTFGQIVETKPQFPNEKTTQLRLDLIKEELNELNQAIESKDLNLWLQKGYNAIALGRSLVL